MPTKDRTRVAVERAADRAARIVERFKDVVPLGPTQVRMTKRELQANLKNAKGAEMLALMERLGPEKIMEMMRANTT